MWWFYSSAATQKTKSHASIHSHIYDVGCFGCVFAHVVNARARHTADKMRTRFCWSSIQQLSKTKREMAFVVFIRSTDKIKKPIHIAPFYSSYTLSMGMSVSITCARCTVLNFSVTIVVMFCCVSNLSMTIKWIAIEMISVTIRCSLKYDILTGDSLSNDHFLLSINSLHSFGHCILWIHSNMIWFFFFFYYRLSIEVFCHIFF